MCRYCYCYCSWIPGGQLLHICIAVGVVTIAVGSLFICLSFTVAHLLVTVAVVDAVVTGSCY